MAKRKGSSTATFVDPDDAPELAEAWFESADLRDGAKLVRRGRPPSEDPKQSVHLRLSSEVLDHFRASGPGWQTRINEALVRIARRARKERAG